MDEGAGCSEDQDPRISPKTSHLPVSSYFLQCLPMYAARPRVGCLGVASCTNPVAMYEAMLSDLGTKSKLVCVTYSFSICLFFCLQCVRKLATLVEEELSLTSHHHESCKLISLVARPDQPQHPVSCGEGGFSDSCHVFVFGWNVWYLVCEWMKTPQCHSTFSTVCLCNHLLAMHAQWHLMTVCNVLKNSAVHVYTLYWLLGYSVDMQMYRVT